MGRKRTRHWSPAFPMMRRQARSARLRPTPFPDTARARDCECKRHGTVTADLVTGHRCGGRPAPGVHRLSPSTGRQLPSRNQTSTGTTAHTETRACDLPVRVHAKARAEPRGVVLQQGGPYLASRSNFEGRTRGTRGTIKQPVAFKWIRKDTPAETLFWNFYTGPIGFRLSAARIVRPRVLFHIISIFRLGSVSTSPTIRL